MKTALLQPSVILIACIVGIWAATTTHAPREHGENESIGFVYNSHSHSLLVITRTRRLAKCYVISLSDAERHDVHTDSGMRTIELKYLAMLSLATLTTHDALSHFDQRSCGHAPKNGTIEYYSL